MRAAKLYSGPVMMFAGIMHFVIPKTYESIMPTWLPAHRELVYASGVTEFAAGAGSLHPRTRRAAGWLGILTMIGVFPANAQMCFNSERYKQIPLWALWARLPLQGVFIYWIYKATLKRAPAAA
jgi:uncharacterized membrane protein